MSSDKLWNQVKGCFDPFPTEVDCARMRQDRACPYWTCLFHPCWDDDEVVRCPECEDISLTGSGVIIRVPFSDDEKEARQ